MITENKKAPQIRVQLFPGGWMGGVKAASFPIIFALEGVKKPLYRPFLGKVYFLFGTIGSQKDA